MQYDLEHRLAIFVSEEMQFWHSSRKLAKPSDTRLRDLTVTNVDAVVRRAELLACKMDREKVCATWTVTALLCDHAESTSVRHLQQPIGSVPINETVIGLILHATNPLRLASLDVAALPWL